MTGTEADRILADDVLRLVGGPSDGTEIYAKGYHHQLRIGEEPVISVDPDSMGLDIIRCGIYEARTDPSSGRRSRADDGAILFDWKGWR